ncbi:hypothetical protein CSUNSWCD_7 [Campylobacter showae CSUNSWCD]|uniref:Uncharacterized protein n=1 Tax=Campylobacter showae CSUNSWCD TaxID=1244083 RepID=M5IHP1_9BACT|nr:hypothetical protein CSUNSWCD_7 [Campylobacter showae CSUNSWCD]
MLARLVPAGKFNLPESPERPFSRQICALNLARKTRPFSAQFFSLFNPPKFTPAFSKFPIQFHSNLTALWLLFRKFYLQKAVSPTHFTVTADTKIIPG